MFSTSDDKKILLTTRNVRLDSGNYATKYYLGKNPFVPHNFVDDNQAALFDLKQFQIGVNK